MGLVGKEMINATPTILGKAKMGNERERKMHFAKKAITERAGVSKEKEYWRRGNIMRGEKFVIKKIKNIVQSPCGKKKKKKEVMSGPRSVIKKD